MHWLLYDSLYDSLYGSLGLTKVGKSLPGPLSILCHVKFTDLNNPLTLGFNLFIIRCSMSDHWFWSDILTHLEFKISCLRIVTLLDQRGTPGNWKLETPKRQNPFEPAFVAPSQADAAGPFLGRVCRSFGSRLSVPFFPSAATCC